MTEANTSDPMPAIGFRLGLPVGLEFLDLNKDLVLKLYGAEFLHDLVSSARDSDIESARRVAEHLVPGVSYQITETPEAIVVEYEIGVLKGKATTNRINPQVTQASCLVSTACSLKHTMDRDIAPGGRPMR